MYTYQVHHTKYQINSQKYQIHPPKYQIHVHAKYHIVVFCRMEHRANLLWIPPDSDYNIKEVSKASKGAKQYKYKYKYKHKYKYNSDYNIK